MRAAGTTPAATLRDEQIAAQQLIDLLAQEEACLISEDADALSKLTAEKSRIAVQMAGLAQRRHALLGTAGFEAAEGGMQGWLRSGNASEEDAGAWVALLSLAMTAKERNRVNGLLIGQHLARNQAALGILQGNAQGGAFYGPNGHSTSKIGSRGLAIG